jgi:hypothetical protein
LQRTLSWAKILDRPVQFFTTVLTCPKVDG